MTAIEVALILIGAVFLIGSFFITEQLSPKELDKIATLSEKEIQMITNKELAKAAGQIEEQAKDVIEESMGRIERSMDKEANQKILEIGEYSDTVLENMNKTHNEIMFLYSMLNDKHTELTDLAGALAELSGEMNQMEEKIQKELARAAEAETFSEQKGEAEEAAEPESSGKNPSDEQSEAEKGNHNERILELYKEGKTYVEIAKELGLGLGEVKLVIELFRGEE